MHQLWSELPEISVAQIYFSAQTRFEIEFPVIDYSEGLKNKWCLQPDPFAGFHSSESLLCPWNLLL